MKIFNHYITNEDFLWFVGYFEGEGCVNFNKQNNGNYCIRLTISSTDFDILKRVKKIIKRGHLKPRNYIHKPIWTWYITKQTETLPLMKMMYKFMGIRRKKRMKEAIEYMQSKPYLGLMDRMKNYNPNQYLKKNRRVL